MDYTIISKAGLTKTEAARIVGVSQPMMWKYINEGQVPRELYKGRPIRQRMLVLLALLDKLVVNGKLPKKDIPFAKRMNQEAKEKRQALLRKLSDIVDAKIAERVTNT